jgi:hypothetical protein
MNDREGRYEYRRIRYARAIEEMIRYGLDNSMTIVDVGAGMTEFDYCLRTEFDWRGRYIPVDGGIDGTDLNDWTPPRRADWFVAMELLEHIGNWESLVSRMQLKADKGIVMSTPNPYATDVIGMDPTHVREIYPRELVDAGFKVYGETFYGRVFNLPGRETHDDSLFGVWAR